MRRYNGVSTALPVTRSLSDDVTNETNERDIAWMVTKTMVNAEQWIGTRNRLALGLVLAAICIGVIMLMFYQSKGRLGIGSTKGRSNQGMMSMLRYHQPTRYGTHGT